MEMEDDGAKPDELNQQNRIPEPTKNSPANAPARRLSQAERAAENDESLSVLQEQTRLRKARLRPRAEYLDPTLRHLLWAPRVARKVASRSLECPADEHKMTTKELSLAPTAASCSLLQPPSSVCASATRGPRRRCFGGVECVVHPDRLRLCPSRTTAEREGRRRQSCVDAAYIARSYWGPAARSVVMGLESVLVLDFQLGNKDDMTEPEGSAWHIWAGLE
ncbi:hypothetical protein B0J13DRAFT_524256 [Dactylonectria estremocensis]|uniref:Uncharacterized protein n=1 Tax=Dactylonectria estremocensis TaxID=1079267 RepID=A0A9P9J8S1_9HYPO|nr:hypothetical protein B0J13DRAFT_524256 [Dactylonectria estremocensis]